MKNRLKAILLATGLTASMMFTCAYADDASTEAATEAVTEAATEAATEEATEAAATEAAAAADEASTEAAEESSEAVSGAAAEESSEVASEAAAVEDAAQEAAATGKYAAYYENLEQGVVQTLTTLSAMTGDTLQQAIDNTTDSSQKAMLATWQSVEEELGSFVSAESQTVTEEGNELTITTVAKYEKIDEGTPVDVVYTVNAVTGEASIKWNVDYPMSKLLEQAALNTIMGIGIVFLALLFLSFLISQMHWIPDLLNKKEKEEKAAEAAAPVQTVSAPAAEEEDLTDDLELVAVISAAIAASENTSADGFVVRSIKKSNRRKWQNA